jgi:hypothetical protein
LTVGDVMRILQISENSVLRHASELNGLKTLGRYRFRREDIDAYIDDAAAQHG